jgi:hypothetical protein
MPGIITSRMIALQVSAVAFFHALGAGVDGSHGISERREIACDEAAKFAVIVYDEKALGVGGIDGHMRWNSGWIARLRADALAFTRT